MIGVILRDLRIGLRTGGGFGLGIGFFLVFTACAAFGLGPDPDTQSRAAPGLLWIGALLSCLLSVDRLFGPDFEDGTLDLLATAPVPLETVVLAKVVVHWLLSALPLVVLAPVLGIVLQFPAQGTAALVASLLIGTPALSLLGAFGAALTVGVRRGGVLLTLLVLPLYLPVLMCGAQWVRLAATGQPLGGLPLLLAGITVAAMAIVPFAAGAALRVTLRQS